MEDMDKSTFEVIFIPLYIIHIQAIDKHSLFAFKLLSIYYVNSIVECMLQEI